LQTVMERVLDEISLPRPTATAEPSQIDADYVQSTSAISPRTPI